MSFYSDSLDNELRKRMRALKIFEKDIDESFIRSSGPGGQNVNKVSTCVQLYHGPSGVTVKCQSERTQALNRIKARKLLVAKVEAEERRRVARLKARREKERRRKRKRSKASKERMLETKRYQSEKKKFRKKVMYDE